MIAFVFPGQGSQTVGMGKDLVNDFPQCKEIFERADDTLGYKLSDICFNGPEELLKQTENTQPALFVHSLSIFELLKSHQIDATAGHSLGEYSALTAAEVFSFEDCLKIVRKRGQLMQESGIKYPGTMAAVVGLSEEKIEEVCKIASANGVVQPANFNSPGQIVISGSISGVRKAIEIAKQSGARLAKELVVSGAFHSTLMSIAYENISLAFENVCLTRPKFPVYSNVTSFPFENEFAVKDLLIKQILSPVKWQHIIENMSKSGITKFVEIGAGKVLTGLIKRINSAAEIVNISNSTELKQFLETWKK